MPYWASIEESNGERTEPERYQNQKEVNQLAVRVLKEGKSLFVHNPNKGDKHIKTLGDLYYNAANSTGLGLTKEDMPATPPTAKTVAFLRALKLKRVNGGYLIDGKQLVKLEDMPQFLRDKYKEIYGRTSLSRTVAQYWLTQYEIYGGGNVNSDPEKKSRASKRASTATAK